VKKLSTESNKNVRLVKKVSAVDFSQKIDPGTLIMALQKDLVRVHDFAMSQERPTTYVLSDFNIQLKAIVTQEKDKTMIVLPSKPGELDPNLLSLVNITLKPIPLQVKPTTEIRPVEAIEGIGLAIGERLRTRGIQTVSDLAQASSQTLIELNIPRKKAEEFISMSKLMLKSNIAGVEGVDEQAAELLVVAGKIDSKEKLAQANPEQLYRVINEAIETKKVKIPAKRALAVEDVKRWVDSAKAIVERNSSEACE
jgi:hypothetical protein